MSITLTPDLGYGKVSESQLAEVEFGGNVTIEKEQWIERVTVTLEASCNRGWPSVVSPQTIPFINPGTARFTLQVIVPPGCQVMEGVATVHAHANSPIWEDDQYAECRVRVLQYFKFEMWRSSNSYSGKPGGSLMGRITINNSGNDEDTFTLAFQDLPDVVSKGYLSEEAITIPPGFYMDVKFTLDFIEDMGVPMDGEMHTVMFRATSVGAEDAGHQYSKTYPIYIYFKGLKNKLYDEWPTYVALGATAAIIIAPPVYLVRRRRRKREEAEGELVVEEG